jgi:hypothetical protein
MQKATLFFIGDNKRRVNNLPSWPKLNMVRFVTPIISISKEC